MMRYKKGDIVEYRVPGGHLRHVRVGLKRGNIKNGEPGFQGEIVWDSYEAWSSGDQAWGYNRWIQRVNPIDQPITLEDLMRGVFNPYRRQ